MSEAEFWRATPFQTRNRIDAAAENRLLDHRMTLWGAWHSAAFYRAKKLPTLETVLRNIDRRNRKPMTPDEMLKMFESINVAVGGKDLRH